MLDIFASEANNLPPIVQKQRQQKNRIQPATLVYRVFVRALEERRRDLGLSFEHLNDLSGVADGFTQKLLRPDTPTGRQSRWDTLDMIVEALFGTDYEIEIKPKNYRAPKPRETRAAPVRPKGQHWRRRQMFSIVFSELGRRGGAARAKLGPERLKAIARKAAKTRRRKARNAQRQREKHKSQSTA